MLETLRVARTARFLVPATSGSFRDEAVRDGATPTVSSGLKTQSGVRNSKLKTKNSKLRTQN